MLFSGKPKIDNLEAFRDITDDVIERDFVPYACHWDPYTIVTRNGELLQVIKITGFAHERLSHRDEDTDLRSKIREAVLSSIHTPNYAVWIHTIRRKKDLHSEGTYPRDFAGYLDRFWNDRNDWENQFGNEVYITVVREGESAELSDPRCLARGLLPGLDARLREQYLDEALADLNVVVKNMLPILDRYGARRLGIFRRGETYYSEPSGFLAKLITMLDHDYPVTDVDMADYMTNYDVTFGFNAMEVRMRENGRRRFGALLTVKEYRELPPEALDRFLHIPGRFIISQCFDFVNARFALKDFHYQKELFNLSKARMLSDKSGLNNILASNTKKPTDFGLHQMTVFALADSIKDLDFVLNKAAGALIDLGMIPMREDVKLEECYWAQLPGNFEFLRRMRPINTARIAGFANLSNYPAGQRSDNKWGPAVTTFYTAARTPYFFNFHVGDNGHTTLVGPFGTGKTVLMNFLIAQSRKFNGKLFFFDRDRSSEIFLRSLNGAYYTVYPRTDMRPYMDVSFNPFQMEDTPKNRDFLQGWIRSLVNIRSEQEAAFERACKEALAAIMPLAKPERVLRAIVSHIISHNDEFAESFTLWIGEGEHANLFDSKEDTLILDRKVYGFEMADAIRYRETLVPILSYLLYRIDNALDGSPTILVMDEAWTYLDTILFSTAARIKNWLNGLSKKNAMVILATEHVEDAQASPVSADLMEHIATQIYLPDESADESYMESFGLTDKEIAYLSVMNTDDRHFLLKRGKDTIVAELNLNGMDDIIAVLSATHAHLDAMERVIAEYGLDPAKWMPKFLERI